jgi:hypothetical protein
MMLFVLVAHAAGPLQWRTTRHVPDGVPSQPATIAVRSSAAFPLHETLTEYEAEGELPHIDAPLAEAALDQLSNK